MAVRVPRTAAERLPEAAVRNSPVPLVIALLLIGPACLLPAAARATGASPPAAPAGTTTDSYPLEVMLVLDRSGSMAGGPLAALKSAAATFVILVASRAGDDRMGLVSFATAVTVHCAMDTDFSAPMTIAINGLTAFGATNAEDALDQAGGPDGFTDRAAVPGAERARRALVFFSDGSPTAFRGSFLRNGTTRDAVACVTGNCAVGEDAMYDYLMDAATGADLAMAPSMPTGDGTTTRVRCSGSSSLTYTTRWCAFDTDPVPDGAGGFYAATANCIPEARLHDHVCTLAQDLALAHAQELKDAGVTIYTIGLGSRVNTDFMQRLASNPDLYFYAPTSSQLEAVFEAVAYSLLPPATPARKTTFGEIKSHYR